VPLRLLVVDADRRVRSSLAGLLALVDSVEVVGTVGHARAALEACETQRPDAVVIDPRLPELTDGVAFIRGLRASRPEVQVVAVAWSPVLGDLLGDDPTIRVVSPDGGDLAERILEAIGPEPPVTRSGPGGDAILDESA
jgi:CheY-like chemotaxis protein